MDAKQQSKTILIMDDDPTVRSLITRILKGNGYEILEASSGDEAVEFVKEGINFEVQIDLLITDVRLPVLGGRETAERIREVYPQIKILFMSGHHEDEVLHEMVRRGEANFIEKPFLPDALRERVHELLAD